MPLSRLGSIFEAVSTPRMPGSRSGRSGPLGRAPLRTGQRGQPLDQRPGEEEQQAGMDRRAYWGGATTTNWLPCGWYQLPPQE